MPVVSVTAAGTAGDVLDLARAHLNDVPDPGDAPAVYTDAKLFPFLNSAYRRTQKELAAAGVSIMREEVIITILAGTDTIDDQSAPPLPSDYLFPQKLKERGAASTERWTDVIPAQGGLSDRLAQLQMIEYQILGDGLNFIGATRDIDLWLRYEKALPALAMPADPLRIRGAIDMLAYRTAANATRSRGVQSLAADLLAQYEQEKTLWLAEYWKPTQRFPARRRPYGARRRVPYQ